MQILIDNDAIALIAIANGAELAAIVIQVIGIGAQLTGDLGILQIIAVVAPGAHGSLVAHHEQRGRSVLIHGGGQGLIVRAGGSCLDGDRHTGLFGVHSSDLLEGGVSLRLEIQPKDTAGCILLLAAGDQCKCHDECENKR